MQYIMPVEILGGWLAVKVDNKIFKFFITIRLSYELFLNTYAKGKRASLTNSTFLQRIVTVVTCSRKGICSAGSLTFA